MSKVKFDDDALGGRILALIAEIDRVYAEYAARNKFNHSKTRHVAEFVSDKWCKIVTEDLREDGTVSGRSVYGFVALRGFSNRTLGFVVAGDIHKAAGWATPAKTPRGNVFKEDFGGCLTPHGIVYLR